jgi:hypothetical protein
MVVICEGVLPRAYVAKASQPLKKSRTLAKPSLLRTRSSGRFLLQHQLFCVYLCYSLEDLNSSFLGFLAESYP